MQLKNIFGARTRIVPDHTRPDPHRHSSIIRAVEHPHQHQLDSPRLGCCCPSSAPHQEPLYKNNSRPDGECKIQTKKYIALGAHYFVICAPAAAAAAAAAVEGAWLPQ